MEREAPARLNGSVFDYLNEDAIRATLSKMQSDGVARRKIAIKGVSGAVYSGHLRLFEDTGGYTIMLEPLDADAERIIHDTIQVSQTTVVTIQVSQTRIDAIQVSQTTTFKYQ